MAMNPRLLRPRATAQAPVLGPTDEHFSYVSLLLHMDGANGSQVFTDSSPVPKTITVTSSAAISTVQSKFGGASGRFPGSGATLPSSADFEFDGDFTVEGWFYFTANNVGYQPLVASDSGSDATAWIFLIEANNYLYWYGSSGYSWAPALSRSSNYQPPVNQWVHLAVVRNGQVLSLYADGVDVTDPDQDASVGSIASGSTVSVARYLGLSPLNGYIDELRITRGVARYTADFTPPTAAFPNSAPAALPQGPALLAAVLTSGTSYTVPAGATRMKAWAIGSGSVGNAPGGAGGCAYKTWPVTAGTSVTYSLGAARAPSPNNGGQATSVTYAGTTIIGNGGSQGTGGSFSGGDGGAKGGNASSGWGTYGSSGGAVGGNGTRAACGRRPARDVSGLFAALALAGVTTSETCADTAAFGSGGADDKYGPHRAAGFGGGGIAGPSFLASNGVASGAGAVVLYFT